MLFPPSSSSLCVLKPILLVVSELSSLDCPDLVLRLSELSLKHDTIDTSYKNPDHNS